jgi:putative transposase
MNVIFSISNTLFITLIRSCLKFIENQSIKVMIQYSTNLTDKQWQVIEKIINTQERKRKHSLRNIMNAILYLLKTGCQWRMIPKDFAPWESVYYYFCKWKNEGII